MQYQPTGKEELGNMVQNKCCVCVGGGGGGSKGCKQLIGLSAERPREVLTCDSFISPRISSILVQK